MVDLVDIHEVSLSLQSGKYTGEDVVKFFRRVYGDKFSSHDLNRACTILRWDIRRRSGKSDIITVK